MNAPSPRAAHLIIGNEILSGRTQDKNLNFLSVELGKLGIRMSEARVVPDIKEKIIDAVNSLRREYDYVFTTGGIGPTHDDITSESIAKAFGLAYGRNKEAEAILRNHYSKEDLNEARLKMANMPEGATLIENPVSAAPGYRIENVYVMAGVPKIMQAMFANVSGSLRHGRQVLSTTIEADTTEGVIAEPLGEIQKRFPDVDIGSYPTIRPDRLSVSIVLRAEDEALLQQAATEVEALLKSIPQ